jgi:hypothetical protein
MSKHTKKVNLKQFKNKQINKAKKELYKDMEKGPISNSSLFEQAILIDNNYPGGLDAFLRSLY